MHSLGFALCSIHILQEMLPTEHVRWSISSTILVAVLSATHNTSMLTPDAHVQKIFW